MEPIVEKNKPNTSAKVNTDEKLNSSKAVKNIKLQMKAQSLLIDATGIFLQGLVFGLGTAAAASAVKKAQSYGQPKADITADNLVQIRRQQVGNT